MKLRCIRLSGFQSFEADSLEISPSDVTLSASTESWTFPSFPQMSSTVTTQM